jgi:thiosulfate dehydrogenase [quinone] large subunit
MSTTLSDPHSRVQASEARSIFSDTSLAYGILRFAFGINIFGHGFIRVMTGTDKFVVWMLKEMQGTMMPEFMVRPFGYLVPWAETTLGLLLILGLFTRTSLVLGGLLIAALTFGTALRQDWGVAGLQVTYSLVYFVLLFLREKNNQWSLDAWLERSRSRAGAAAIR